MKRVSERTKQKIGRGVKAHHDKKGRKKRVGLVIGALGIAGVGLLALNKRKNSLTNPYVERAKLPVIGDKTTTSNIKESFYDLRGKFRRKGQFMPKGQGEPMVGPRKQIIKIKDSYSRENYRPVTIDVEGIKLSAYTKGSLDFKKEEVDSYVTKKGKKVRSFKRTRKQKPHLLDDKVVRDRYVAQSRIFDKRVNDDNAKEVFDTEEKGYKTGETIGKLATPLALYGLGKFALSKNSKAKEAFNLKVSSFNNSVDNLTHAAQKGAYSSQLKRVHKLGYSQNSIGQLGTKGVSKAQQAFKIGKQAQRLDKGIGLAGKALKKFNSFGLTVDAGVDVLAGPTQYKTRTFNTKQGPVNVQLPTMGSTIKRNVIPGLVIGMPIAVAGSKIAKERYFKNKEKDKK